MKRAKLTLKREAIRVVSDLSIVVGGELNLHTKGKLCDPPPPPPPPPLAGK